MTSYFVQAAVGSLFLLISLLAGSSHPVSASTAFRSDDVEPSVEVSQIPERGGEFGGLYMSPGTDGEFGAGPSENPALESDLRDDWAPTGDFESNVDSVVLQQDTMTITAIGRNSWRYCLGYASSSIEQSVTFDLLGGAAIGKQTFRGDICLLDEEGLPTGKITGRVTVHFTLSGNYPGGLNGSFTNAVVGGTGGGRMNGQPFIVSVRGSWYGNVDASVGVIRGQNSFSVTGSPSDLNWPSALDMDFYFKPPPEIGAIAVSGEPNRVGVIAPGEYGSLIVARVTDVQGQPVAGYAPTFSIVPTGSTPTAVLVPHTGTTNAAGSVAQRLEVRVNDLSELPLDVSVRVRDPIGGVSGTTVVRFEPAELEVVIEHPFDGLETESDMVWIVGRVECPDPTLVDVVTEVSGPGDYAIPSRVSMDSSGRFSIPVVFGTPLETYRVAIRATDQSGATHADSVRIKYLGVWTLVWDDLVVPELVPLGEYYEVEAVLRYDFPLPKPISVRIWVGDDTREHTSGPLGPGQGEFRHTFTLRAPITMPSALMQQRAPATYGPQQDSAAGSEVSSSGVARLPNGAYESMRGPKMTVGAANPDYTFKIIPVLPMPPTPPPPPPPPPPSDDEAAREGVGTWHEYNEWVNRVAMRANWSKYRDIGTTIEIVSHLTPDRDNPDLTDRLRFFIEKVWVEGPDTRSGGWSRYVGVNLDTPDANGSKHVWLYDWTASKRILPAGRPFAAAGTYRLCVRYEVYRYDKGKDNWVDHASGNPCEEFVVDKALKKDIKTTTLGQDQKLDGFTADSTSRVRAEYSSQFSLAQGDEKWFDTTLGRSSSQSHSEPAALAHRIYLPLVSKDLGPVRLTLEWSDPAVDLDLHVIDPEGRLIGRDYLRGSVRNNVPSAYYSGPTAKPEWVLIHDAPAGEYLVGAYGVSGLRSVNATITLDKPEFDMPAPMPSPTGSVPTPAVPTDPPDTATPTVTAFPSVSPSPEATPMLSPTASVTISATPTEEATIPAPATITPSHTPTPSPTPTEPSPGSCSNVITNGTFEDGLTGWEFDGEVKLRFGEFAGGRYAALVLGRNSVVGSLSQVVSIPAGTSSAHLLYWYQIESDEPTFATKVYDSLTLVSHPPADQPVTLEVLSNLSMVEQWVPSGYDLPVTVGEHEIRFDGSTNPRDPTDFYLDEVELWACEGRAAPRPQVILSPVGGPPGTVFSVDSIGNEPQEQVSAWLLDPDRVRRDFTAVSATGQGQARHQIPTDQSWPAGAYSVGVIGHSAGLPVLEDLVLGGP